VQVLLPPRNNISANAYGAELSAEWRPYHWWTLQATYSYIHFDFDTPDNTLTIDPGVTPQQQAYLRSGVTPHPDWDLDLWLRYTDKLPLNVGSSATYTAPIPAYLTMDARLAWRPVKGLELSVVGQNLLQPRHVEFAQEAYGPPQTVVPRAFYLQLDWRF
jgi:iron complex outermembrane receptor protein